VKKDKVREIKDAIERSSIGNRSNPIKILVLSGPSGSGKSTLIRLLSKTMQLELIEWKNPTNEYDHHHQTHYGTFH
jgi:cell cycle checkpoint protein